MELAEEEAPSPGPWGGGGETRPWSPVSEDGEEEEGTREEEDSVSVRATPRSLVVF